MHDCQRVLETGFLRLSSILAPHGPIPVSDASGLANLLASQKSNVSAAVPAGFSKYLSGAGIPDDVVVSGARATSRAQASAPPSIWPWLLGALVLLTLGALAWHFLAGRHKQVVEPVKPPVEGQATTQAPYAGLFDKLRDIKAGDVDVTQYRPAPR